MTRPPAPHTAPSSGASTGGRRSLRDVGRHLPLAPSVRRHRRADRHRCLQGTLRRLGHAVEDTMSSLPPSPSSSGRSRRSRPARRPARRPRPAGAARPRRHPRRRQARRRPRHAPRPAGGARRAAHRRAPRQPRPARLTAAWSRSRPTPPSTCCPGSACSSCSSRSGSSRRSRRCSRSGSRRCWWRCSASSRPSPSAGAWAPGCCPAHSVYVHAFLGATLCRHQRRHHRARAPGPRALADHRGARHPRRRGHRRRARAGDPGGGGRRHRRGRPRRLARPTARSASSSARRSPSSSARSRSGVCLAPRLFRLASQLRARGVLLATRARLLLRPRLARRRDRARPHRRRLRRRTDPRGPALPRLRRARRAASWRS